MRLDSGISLIRAIPPSGQSVMSTTRRPYRIATTLCASSWSRTIPNVVAQ
jgi:hypothetical protein